MKVFKPLTDDELTALAEAVFLELELREAEKEENASAADNRRVTTDKKQTRPRQPRAAGAGG
jgi:hypothetical protein